MEVNLKWRIVHEIGKAVSLHDCSIIFVKEPYQDCCLKPIQSISAQCCIAKVLLCKSNDCFYMNAILSWSGLDQCYHHIETVQLICTENPLTGFYMMVISLNG